MKTSFVLYQISPFNLIQSINWVRASGKYVLQDPNNEKLLLYLNDKQYNKLVVTAISQDKVLVVLSTPDDSKDDVEKRFPKPTVDSSTDTPFNRWEYTASKMFSLIPGWKVKESMIRFERNFEYFLPIYYRDIISWLGSRTSTKSEKEMWTFSKRMNTIYKTRGINQIINTYKIYSICILKYLGGTPLESTQDLGQRVRLINGLPAKIPSHFRLLIRSNNILQIRALLSLLHSYKGFEGKWGKAKLDSITASRFVPQDKFAKHIKSDFTELFPILPKLVLRENWDEVDKSLVSFWKEINPRGLKATLLSSIEELSIPMTAGPNHSTSVMGLSLDALAIMSSDKFRSLWFSFNTEAEYVAKSQNTFIPHPTQSLLGAIKLTCSKLLTSLMKDNKEINKLVNQVPFLRHRFGYNINEDNDTRRALVLQMCKSLRLGKLAIKLEAAGKVRVFAISDYWTQNMCRPLHKSIFDLLKGLPCDATFNQEGRVKEFQSRNYSYIASFDLKSATDLIPIQLYEKVIGQWTTPAFAMAWSALLTKREYFFEGSNYVYTRGQPMGTLSSWASLALVHHFLVFLSAQRAGIKHFSDYLVLGDDIVIANELVANKYKEVCNDYGITIGLPKSFISRNGLFQFASQDIRAEINFSPISLKEVLSCSGHSYYFGKDFNLAKRLEWLNRLIRRNFIDQSSLVNFIRPLMTYNEYKKFSLYLSKGNIPSTRVNLIVSVLSNLVFTKEDNAVTLDQFIASLRGEYGLFSNTIKLDPHFKREMLLLFYKTMKADFVSYEKSLAPHLNLQTIVKSLNATLVGVNDILMPSLLQGNSNTLSQYMRIKKEFNSLIKELEADLTSEMWSVLYFEEAGKICLDFAKLSKLFVLRQEIEGLCVRRDLFKKAVTSIDTKVPYLTRLHFSLLDELVHAKQREENY